MRAGLFRLRSASTGVFGVLILLLPWSPLTAAIFTAVNDSPDVYDEPNLIGINPFPDNPNPSVLETLYGEANLRRLDDGSDVAFRHTGVEAIVTAVAKFDISGFVLNYIPNGAKVSLFGEYVTSMAPQVSGYYPDIPPASIPRSASGDVFGLQSHRELYSDPTYNWRTTDYAVTFEIIGNAGHDDNVIGNYVVCWDNSQHGDRDFQDALFEISGVAATSSLAADFNVDLVVDDVDLAMWKSGFGVRYNVALEHGDANRDRRVDGSDFLIWQRSYSPSMAALQVPEPSVTPWLFGAALMAMPRRSRADDQRRGSPQE